MTSQLLEQLTYHWDDQVRPGLDGLTDEEYLWEPVPGAWSIRPRAEARTAMAAGCGDLVADFEFPEPEPAPVTTIAWRLGHVIVGIFGARNAAHFGGPPMDYTSVEWPGDAASALAMLDDLGAALETADLADPGDIPTVPLHSELEVLIGVEPVGVDAELSHFDASWQCGSQTSLCPDICWRRMTTNSAGLRGAKPTWMLTTPRSMSACVVVSLSHLTK